MSAEEPLSRFRKVSPTREAVNPLFTMFAELSGDAGIGRPIPSYGPEAITALFGRAGNENHAAARDVRTNEIRHTVEHQGYRRGSSPSCPRSGSPCRCTPQRMAEPGHRAAGRRGRGRPGESRAGKRRFRRRAPQCGKLDRGADAAHSGDGRQLADGDFRLEGPPRRDRGQARRRRPGRRRRRPPHAVAEGRLGVGRQARARARQCR